MYFCLSSGGCFILSYIGIACCYFAIGDSTFPMLSSIVLSWCPLLGIRFVYKVMFPSLSMTK